LLDWAMNRNLYTDELKNSIRVSEFEKYQGETNFSNVAVKFVVRGKESYIINTKKFQVKQGEYIIGNNNELSEVSISENTVGFCIDISNLIISEILETIFDNPDLKEFMLTDKFLINKYNSEHTSLGHKLNQLSAKILSQQGTSLLCNELFYSIGENIVHDQALVFEQFSKLNYKKQHVNESVFRSLLAAKQYMDECFLDSLNLDDLVHVAHISKYSFIRLFKTTFGITPYHYILNKRLVYAKLQLLSGEAVFDVAIKSGFADGPSFSKAFKQHFGVLPSMLLK
jgi:AraC-like DNA-binding protein